MNVKKQIEDFILNNISKDNIDAIIKSDKVNQEMIDTLWDFSISNKHPQSWRAAWMLFHLLNNYLYIT